jgi:hypothetical protein
LADEPAVGCRRSVATSTLPELESEIRDDFIALGTRHEARKEPGREARELIHRVLPGG